MTDLAKKFGIPSSLFDTVKQIQTEETEYQAKVKALMAKKGINSLNDLSPEEKKKFFSQLDAMHQAKNEEIELNEVKVGDKVNFDHEMSSAPGKKVKKSGTVHKIEGDVAHIKVKDKYGAIVHKKKIGELQKEEIQEAPAGGGTSIKGSEEDRAKSASERAKLTMQAAQLRIKQAKEREAISKKKQSIQSEFDPLEESFSDAQVAKLKAEYSKINTIDPSSDSYKKLIAMLDKLDKPALEKLAGADIKFISGLAKNRVNRMKNEAVVKGRGYDNPENERKGPEGKVPMTSLMPGHNDKAARLAAVQAKGKLVKGKAQSAPQKEEFSLSEGMLSKFKKADAQTKTDFNKYNMKPYDAVYTVTMGAKDEPKYDLTILKHENGKFLAAHGSVVVKQEFSKAEDAAKWLMNWYEENKRPAAKNEEFNLEEDMKSVAGEIETYAMKHGGIDKADMMKVANFLRMGKVGDAKKKVMSMDTDPRDFLMDKMKKLKMDESDDMGPVNKGKEKPVMMRHKTSGKEISVVPSGVKEKQKLGYEVVKEEVEQIDEVKIGDTVHVGMAKKGGAGFKGTVHKIDGEKVHVKVGTTKYGDRIVAGQMKNVTKEEMEISEMDKSQPSSSRGAEGLPVGKKATPITTDKAKNDALKALQQKYKKVKEEVEEQGLAEGSNPIHPELHKKLTASGYTHVENNKYIHPQYGKVKVQPTGVKSGRANNGLRPEGVRIHGPRIDSYINDWTLKSTRFSESAGELEEGKSSTGYQLYHKDFSLAMAHAYDFAKNKYGIEVDPEEIDRKVAMGPRKPSSGKTNSYRLMGKDGKKAIQVQVANLDDKRYELNMYKEEASLNNLFLEVMKKEKEASAKDKNKTVNAGDKLSGKQEPVELEPELKEDKK